MSAASRRCGRSWSGAGEIYLGRFAGWYCVRDEAFYDESELIDGKAPTGAEVEWLEEENSSSGSRRGRTGCWAITKQTRKRSRRAAGAMRSSASSEPG